MFSLKTVLGATVLATLTSAHFTLDYPKSRGFDDDNEPLFCGGFNSTQNPRQNFPITGGPVWIDSHHPLGSVVAFISTNNNPTSFGDFNKTSNGTSIPLLTNFFQVHQGEYCWNTSLAGLNIGLTNGSLVTLQIQYNGGDGNLFQCSDLIIRTDFTPPSNFTCTQDATTNANPLPGSGPVSSISASGSASATSATSAASSAASSAKSGASSVASVSGAGIVGAAAMCVAAIAGFAVVL